MFRERSSWNVKLATSDADAIDRRLRSALDATLYLESGNM
jgi:hypothetical protein